MTGNESLPRFVRLLAFAVANVLYAVYGVGQVVAVLPPGAATGWAALIEVFASPYFIGMVALPSMLVACAATVPSATATERILRYGSRTRAALHVALERAVFAVPFVAVILLVNVAVSARLGWQGGWGPAVEAGRSTNLVFGALAGRLPPLSAVAAQVSLLLAAAWLCAVITSVIAVWSSGQRLLRWVCAGIVLWTWVAFKLPVTGTHDLLAPMTYLAVHIGAAEARPLLLLLVLVLGAGVALILGSLAVEQGRKRWWPGRAALSPVGVWAAVSATALTAFESLRQPWMHAEDSLVLVFFGFSAERLDVMGVVVHLLLTVGAAFALHVRFTDRLQGGAYTELVRCRSTIHWWWRLHLRQGLLVSALVPVGVVVVHVVVSGLHGVAPSIDGNTLVHFLVATAVQIAVSILLFSSLTLVSGDTAVGVWLIGVALMSSLPVVFRLGVLPFGLSSMSLPRAGTSLLHVAGVLALWGLAAFAVTAWSTRVRGLQLHSS